MNKIISLSIFVFLCGRRCLNVGVVVASSSSPTQMTTKSTITATDSIGSPKESSSLLSSKIPTTTTTEKSTSTSTSNTNNSIGSPESLKLSPRIVSLNIMVAGLAGMGKTTMCKALLDSWWEKIEEGKESIIAGKKKKKTANTTTRGRRFLSSTMMTTKIDDSSTTTTKKKHQHPTPTVSTTDISPSVPFEYYDEEANTILRVRIIDTPGFGNRVNHRNSVKPITDYISCCRQRRFRREQSPSTVAISTFDDDCYLEEENYNGKNNKSKKDNINSNNRSNNNNENNYNSMLVHVCLYFISPGRFLAIDRHFLKHVQSEVTIVPIIAKADTLTDDEIANFRAELTKIWKEESIDVYSLDDDDHNPSSSIRSEKNKIVLNTDSSLKRTTLYRGRRPGEVLAVIARDGKYPWGNSCALDPEHSDLQLIRDSILSDHTERFLELATEKYGIYRDQQFARQKRSDWIKYAALLGLTAIQFRKVEMIRGVFSKVVLSLVPVQRILSKLLLSLGVGNNTTSPLVKDNDDDNDELMVSDDVSSSSSSDRKSIFEFFGIPSFDSIRKQHTNKNE